MSSITPVDAPQSASLSVPRKKSKKKKPAKGKSNGETVKDDANIKLEEADVDDGDGEGDDFESTSSNTLVDHSLSQEIPDTHTNGKAVEKANGHIPPPESLLPVETEIEANATDRLDTAQSNVLDTREASSRLEAMSQEREALRAEVEKLRMALEDIQEKHAEEISMVRKDLEESEAAKDQAETQYQNLFERVKDIRSTLGERLAADKQELAEANDQIEKLQSQNKSLEESNQGLEAEKTRLTEESQELSQELSSLRNRHNLSQQNWLHEREDLTQQTKQLKEEADAAKEAMGDWEVLAMEERSIREGLADRVQELEDQLTGHKELYERASSERESQTQAIDGLQRALNVIQEARKVELREMVESTQAQVDVLNKRVQEAEARATEAEARKELLTKELERAAPFEKEVKEKNLLIGKLRHEAIILNDHLAKALRFLKKAKPEDNIDRQIVTNYFLHFLALDRSDPKKFEILKFIAQLLNWTDEQREKAGLARPGASNASSSLRLPISSFQRTPSTPSINSDFEFGAGGTRERGESLAELWAGFLRQEAESESVESAISSRSPSFSLPLGSKPVVKP